MGYIDKHLMTGEKVVYKAHLHGIIYLLPILAFIPFVVLSIAVPSPITLIVLFAALIFCIFWSISIYGGKQFVLTTRRVIIKEGIVQRKVNELMLRKCEGIQVEQSIMGRIFDYGTLLVSTGEQMNRYKMIKDPVTFSTRINEQIDSQANMGIN